MLRAPATGDDDLSVKGVVVVDLCDVTDQVHAHVADVVQPPEITVAPGITVAQLVESHMLPRNLRAVPVVDNTRLVGVVTMGDVMRVPVDQRGQVFVGQIMGGHDGLYTVTGDTGVLEAIDLLAEHDLEQLPVLDGGQLIGMLTRADVMRQLQLREALTPSR